MAIAKTSSFIPSVLNLSSQFSSPAARGEGEEVEEVVERGFAGGCCCCCCCSFDLTKRGCPDGPVCIRQPLGSTLPLKPVFSFSVPSLFSTLSRGVVGCPSSSCWLCSCSCSCLGLVADAGADAGAGAEI